MIALAKPAAAAVAGEDARADERTAARPRTRGECADGPRPCPWLSCRHHLFAPPASSTAPTAAALDAMEELIFARLGAAAAGDPSCALDVVEEADEELTLDVIAATLGPSPLSLARVRQLERRGLSVLRGELLRRGIDPREALESVARHPRSLLRRGGSGSKR